MVIAPLPADETERLRALSRLEVLDSAPEREFDALVATAALICGVPISLLSLVDRERQWFKANVGLPGVTETSREVAFCAHAILDEGVFEVPDALADPRFANNPLVADAPDIRFYAGATLRLSDGAHVGTLCVIDRVPRTLSPTAREALRLLSVAAVQALESRKVGRDFLASEARFRGLSEAAPLGVFATDAQGACTYTNARWREIYGLTEAEALGQGWSRTLHPEDRAEVFTQWQLAATHRLQFDMEFRVRRDDGSVSEVRAVARPVLDADGVVVSHVGSVEDVTTRKAQQVQLRRSEELLNRTGELVQLGGWEFDIPSQRMWWSRQAGRIAGLAPGQAITLEQAMDLYAPSGRPMFESAIAAALAHGKDWDLELPFVQLGGQRLWVRVVGHVERDGRRPVRLLGTLQDITQQVQQRQRLEEAQQRASLAADNGGIGVWEREPHTGVRRWDARSYQLFGLPADCTEDPSAVMARQVHADDRQRLEQAKLEALRSGQRLDIDYRVVWPDGSVRHLHSAARVSHDGHGQGARLIGVHWDVTPLRELNARLAEQHELLRVTLHSIGDAVITTDARGRVTWMNPVAERMTGWSSTDAVGLALTRVFRIVNEQTRQAAEDPVALCLRDGSKTGLAMNTLLLARDGAEFGIEDSAAPIRGPGGEVLGAVLVFHDVTEQRRLSGEMNYRATHDPLTGLVNRGEFELRLRQLIERTHVHGGEHAMLFIDLDQFKLVNDACGHAVGDQLLQQVAKLLREAVRSRDLLARLGGDEFAVLLEHCSVEHATRVAQQMCDRMEQFRFVHEERRFRVGASIGLVPLDRRWHSATAAMTAADGACYAAKEAGRNRVHAWLDTEHALRARQGQMQWATRLEQALDEDRFVLHAQCIAPLLGKPAGLHAEVLIRLPDADGTLTPPGAFLPAAERFHMATRIDRWVLKQVVRHMLAIPDLTRLDTLCVNLSGQSVGDRAFHRHALEFLAAAGEAVCRRLCLEITETAAVTNMADAARFIQQVRALGVRVALDDFGAGASSFGYLKTLQVDLLKIDGSFVRDLVDDPLDRATVRCFVDVARVLGVKTVAEFVDRPPVLECLREMRVDYAQGFLLHKPEPLERVLGTSRPDAAPGAW